jgi:Carboxypeptidase regulatory-like domain
MFRMRGLACLLAVLLVLGFSLQFDQPVYGQASAAAGSLQGTVTDPNGANVPNATVTVLNTATAAQKVVTTDSAGFYNAGSLAPGRYQITIVAGGFARQTTTLTVQIGVVTNGDAHLKVGAATEQVEVSAETLQVNTTQSTVAGVLTEQQIDNLPISGRNFLDLSQLEPGVQLQSGETFDPTKAGYSSISFNGVNGRTARILLDGQDISDETVGTTTLNVSQGSIEEFQISRSSLDISNELTSSGAVTVSTRSGSNSVHGQGFYQFRDQRAGAANGPDGTDYPFQRSQFGGRVGFPILKDKLFAFGTAERVKQDSFNAVAQLDPFTAYNGGYNAPFRDNYYASREDWNAPHGIHTFFRFSYENNVDDSTFGYGYSRYGNKDNTPAFAGGADFLTGRITNSVRGSYLKFHNLIADETAAGVPNLAPGVFLDIHGLITGPNLLAPQQTFQSDKQLRYDGGLTFKSHVFNFGISLNRILGGGFASFFGFAPELRGNFAAGPVNGGDPSDPTAYTTSYIVMGNGQGFNTEKSEFGYPAGGQGDWRLGLYFGDTWKVNNKLTLNYGVRYSHDTGRSDSDLAPIPCSDAVAVWGTASPCTTGNLLDALKPGLGDRVSQPNSDWGPKAGFAYDLKGDGKTVIRGGAGIYYENVIFNSVLFDRPGRLAKGLFWSNTLVAAGQSSVSMPDGSTVTSIDGIPIGSLWNMPIKDSAKAFGDLQALYQQKTKAVGASANPSYIAYNLAAGGNANGVSFFEPKFKTPYSVQMNLGVQRQMWKGGILSVDWVRNIGTRFTQQIDENRVGDASAFNQTAAKNAINATLAQFKAGSVDEAIAKGATISDFAANGLDSGNALFSGYPAVAFGSDPDHGAAFPGINPSFGTMHFNEPIGRSVYNGLQTNLRQQEKLQTSFLKNINFEVSYSLSRFVSSGGADQNFIPGSTDNNHPTAYLGPAGIDRTHQLSYGGFFNWALGIQTSLIGHYYSSLPASLTLDTLGNSTGEIFQSDLTGDGTTGDLLPTYKSGAYMRTVKPNQLNKVVNQYNAAFANQPTPAGLAVVNAGLMTTAQLAQLGGVTHTIAPPTSTPLGNGNLRTFDFTLSRPTHVPHLGESFSIDPKISFFNLFNFGNYGTVGGNLANFQQPGTANGPDPASDRNALRLGNGSGVFSQGASRIMEFGLTLNF